MASDTPGYIIEKGPKGMKKMAALAKKWIKTPPSDRPKFRKKYNLVSLVSKARKSIIFGAINDAERTRGNIVAGLDERGGLIFVTGKPAKAYTPENFLDKAVKQEDFDVDALDIDALIIEDDETVVEATNADLKKIAAAAKKAGAKVKNGNQLDFGSNIIFKMSIDNGQIRIDGGLDQDEFYKNSTDAIKGMMLEDIDMWKKWFESNKEKYCNVDKGVVKESAGLDTRRLYAKVKVCVSEFVEDTSDFNFDEFVEECGITESSTVGQIITSYRRFCDKIESEEESG